ncbi:hypothetical protein D9Q98_007954 [Chlorella vulgaris]|uniref:Uncharacterized protein n=1 Tax=Chlorella vulgaris TaxID=3077 RepID=A0A9D4YU09_CHLVU|nr:hypothetical protein D9Q98_007954 [Chlorella vulgaris]
MRCVGLASHLRGGKLWPAAPASRPAHPFAARCSSSSNSNSSGDPPGGEHSNSHSSDTVYKGFSKQQQQKATPADALQNTLAGLSAAVGRVPSSNNVILDTTNDEDKWRELDAQVNPYPGQRTFKAIGTGDQAFVAAMTECVESVVGTVHAECVSHRASSKGNYTSVTVGPVWVESPDQVLQIYENMRADGRLRFFF